MINLRKGRATMKRLIFLLLILQILLVSICHAFEPPTDKRWIWLGSTDEIGLWFDAESTQYVICDTYEHKYHKQVNAWVLFYNAAKDNSSKQAVTYDLTCKQYKINSIIIYDNSNKITYSKTYSFPTYESIPPETWSESILKICQIAWENDPRNNLR